MAWQKQKGFSLMELLVVLVILAFMAGVTGPSMGRFLNSLEQRKQTGKILATFRYARLKSVSEGKIVEATLSDDAKKVVFSGAVKETREFDLGDEDSLELSPEKISFFPEGVVTPGFILFHKGERTRKFIFDPLTGLTFEEMEEE